MRMEELKVMPEIREQSRPTNIPTDIARASIPAIRARGADTETIRGRAVILTLETAVRRHGREVKNQLKPELYHINSFQDIVNAFLVNGRKWFSNSRSGFSHPTYFYWNLKFDVQAYIKWLPDASIQHLYETNTVVVNIETGEMVEDWAGYVLPEGQEEMPDWSNCVRLFYLPKKAFRMEFHETHRFDLGDGGKPVSGGRIEHFDMAQFYGTSLKNASSRNLGETKIERCFDGTRLRIERMDDEVLIKVRKGPFTTWERHRYGDYYREDIEFYAMKDAVLTGRLARKKLLEFVNAGVVFRDPYSIASIAQRDLLNKGFREVFLNNLEVNPANRVGLTSYHGGWFEAAEVGFIEDVELWDLKSAYLYSQYHLPAMTRWVPETYICKRTGAVKNRIKHGKVKKNPELIGKWEAGKDLDELLAIVEPRTDLSPAYVYVRAEFMEGRKWFPLCYVGAGGPPLTSPRVFRGWITYDEYVEAKKWDHHYIIVDGWCAWVDDEEDEKSYPFRDFIDYWFGVKESKDKDDPAYIISKQLAVSTYGKTIQDVEGRAGQLYNPHYASMTTGFTRATLARFIRKNEEKVVMVATDGVLIRKDDIKEIPERFWPAVSNLGMWEKENDYAADAVVMMSGVYAFRERVPSKQVAEFVFDPEHPMTPKIQTRMVPKGKSKERGSASYFRPPVGQTWFDFCEQHRDETEVETIVNRPYSLGEARYDFDLINIFDDRPFTMRARGDSAKRLYDPKNRPETFGDLLTRSYTLEPHDSWATVDLILGGGR